MKRVVIRKPWGWETVYLERGALVRPEDVVFAMFLAWQRREQEREHERMAWNLWYLGKEEPAPIR